MMMDPWWEHMELLQHFKKARWMEQSVFVGLGLDYGTTESNR